MSRKSFGIKTAKTRKDEGRWAVFIGERVRIARESRQMTQSELAISAGFQPSAISHFELGRRSPSAENIVKLCDALSVRADWLLGQDDDKSLAGGAHTTALLRAFGKLTATDQTAFLKFAEAMADKSRPATQDSGMPE